MNRRGMTLIELLVTLTIMGILANLAFPALSALRVRAEAARIIGDVAAIRIAAFDHYATHGTYPASGQWGSAPGSLAGSLPPGLAFRSRHAEYRWERWSLPHGAPGDPSQTTLPGLTMRSARPDLVAAVRGLYRGKVSFGSSTEITFVLE